MEPSKNHEYKRQRVHLPWSIRRGKQLPEVSYPLALELQYATFWRRRAVATGLGHTIALTRSIVRFWADRIYCGLFVGLSITWPLLLDHQVQLQLHIWGKVIRSANDEITLEIRRYEFRTRSTGGLGRAVKGSVR